MRNSTFSLSSPHTKNTHTYIFSLSKKEFIMGNCLRLKRGQSSMVCAEMDDDYYWDSSMAAAKEGNNIPAEKQGFLDHHLSSSSSSNIDHQQHKEIKIKITKKQLEKLLGEVEVRDIPVDQILSRLINAGGDDHDSQKFVHQRSWRPRLQSIPEVD